MKHEKFSYDIECLFDEAKESDLLNAWYTCAGDHFCI